MPPETLTTPDFDQIAREFVAQTRRRLVHPWVSAEAMDDLLVLSLRKELIDVWNARGAADLAAVDRALSRQMGLAAASPTIANLYGAVRGLDR